MLNQKDLDSLKVGDLVDLQDPVCRWLSARVIDKNEETKALKFHYEGWISEYDEVLDCSKPNPRIARKRSHVGRISNTNAHLRPSNYVLVAYQGVWYRGKVRRLDSVTPSTQIQVCFWPVFCLKPQIRWFDRSDKSKVTVWPFHSVCPEFLQSISQDHKIWIFSNIRHLRPNALKFGKKRYYTTANLRIFIQIQNDWVVPMEFTTLWKTHHVKFKRRVVTDVRSSIQAHVRKTSITHMSRYLWGGFPNFDYNCRRKLTGFLQGWLYCFTDAEEFEPEFRVKRKRDVPKSDLNLIVDLIVDFVPVWAIFRNCRNDHWYKNR